MVIGTDFDNTLVDYDLALYSLAAAHGWLVSEGCRSKKAIRDALRLQPNGEENWQELQSLIYGPEMYRARLFEGVREFVTRCREGRTVLRVVSHKTQYPSRGEVTVDLRRAAWGWMEQERFFAEDGLAFSREDVYFEPTRAAKLARIKALGCTHFIDDMEETFSDPDFPANVARILFDPWDTGCANPAVRRYRTWKEIGDCLLGASV